MNLSKDLLLITNRDRIVAYDCSKRTFAIVLDCGNEGSAAGTLEDDREEGRVNAVRFGLFGHTTPRGRGG